MKGVTILKLHGQLLPGSSLPQFININIRDSLDLRESLIQSRGLERKKQLIKITVLVYRYYLNKIIPQERN